MRPHLGAVLLVLLSALLPSLATAQAQPPRILAWVESLQSTDEAQIRWPVAVATSDDQIVVADAFQPALFLFTRVGVSWRLETTVTLPAAPIDLTHDGERVVASLRQIPALVAFEGPELLQRRLPVAPGIIPGALAADTDGRLILYDLATGRVLQLDSGTEPGREILVGSGVTALETLPNGGFLVAVADKGEVLRFDAAWQLADTWKLPNEGPVPAWPVGLATESGGDAFIVDRHSGRILVLDVSGAVEGIGSRQGWEPGLLLFPADIDRLPDGRILIADQGNGRLQIFQRTDRSVNP